MQLIYLDNNATTRPDPLVVEAMLPYLTDLYANPSSVHRFGQMARKAIDEARAAVAALVNCRDSELVFTAGGTESINTAIRGLLAARAPRKKIVTSAVEHSAARELCKHLAALGHEVIEIPVNHDGLLDLADFEKSLTDDVALVSLIWANNETGVVFPMDQIADLCKKSRIPLHADATQAVGKIPVDFAKLGFDAASFAAHKFHGPKGAAALYVRRGVRIAPFVLGGPQERQRRGGTENVAAIVGMGKAAQLASQSLPRMNRVAQMRDRLEAGLLAIPDTAVNGSTAHRLPNTTNISFARLEAEAILMLLSERDVCASAGAACSSGSLEPSHVLQAMRIDPRLAHGAIRFSLSRFTTDEEIEQALKVVPGVIDKLRKVMPVAT
jgi:cysteine desulfurase